MKPSTILLGLVPTVALAAKIEQPPAIVPGPSLPRITPAASLPELQSPSTIENETNNQLEARQAVQQGWVAGANDAPAAETDTDTTAATTVPDQWPGPASGTIGLGTLAPRAASVLRARNEGTLGQTPWIGMAIGLTCTALAAVMLG